MRRRSPQGSACDAFPRSLTWAEREINRFHDMRRGPWRRDDLRWVRNLFMPRRIRPPRAPVVQWLRRVLAKHATRVRFPPGALTRRGDAPCPRSAEGPSCMLASGTVQHVCSYLDLQLLRRGPHGYSAPPTPRSADQVTAIRPQARPGVATPPGRARRCREGVVLLVGQVDYRTQRFKSPGGPLPGPRNEACDPTRRPSP